MRAPVRHAVVSREQEGSALVPAEESVQDPHRPPDLYSAVQYSTVQYPVLLTPASTALMLALSSALGGLNTEP